MKQIAESLGILKSKMARLEGQREAAKADFAKARAALAAHIDGENAGDKATTAALKAEIVGARVLMEVLDEKIEEQIALVTAEENRLVDEQTQKRRNADADEILDGVTKIDGQVKPVLAAVRALATDLAKFASFRVEASGISEFLANAANEAEVALSVSIPDMLAGAQAVREGRERAPAKPGAIIKMVAPAPTTARLFLTQHLGFFDEQGGMHPLASMNDHEIPLALVAKARALGAAWDLDSPQRKQHGGSKTSAPPAWAHCKILNENPKAKSNVEPILHSAFERHPDVRPAYTGTMRQPQTGTATRSLPPGKK